MSEVINTGSFNLPTVGNTVLLQPGRMAPGLILQVVGTFTGTFTVEASSDQTTWVDITNSFKNLNTNANVATSISAAGMYQLQSAPPVFMRVKCTALSAGTPTAFLTGLQL